MKRTTVTLLISTLFVLAGCTQSVYRTTWTAMRDQQLIEEDRFMEIVSKINEELELELKEPYVLHDGTIWPVRYTRKLESSNIAPWIRIEYVPSDSTVFLWFDKGFDKLKNQEKIQDAEDRINRALDDFSSSGVTLEIERNENFKTPADIF